VRGPSARVKINPTPSPRADTAPFANERDFVEQRRLDAQHVKSRHVLCVVEAFENEKLDLRITRQIRHAEGSLASSTTSNAKIESVGRDRFRS
jgi:hypothetical protein